jgi:oligoendopeptidase F
MIRAHGAIAVIMLATGRWTAAQTTPFNPFAGSDSLRYRFDLAKNYYESPAASARERLAVAARVRSWLDRVSNVQARCTEANSPGCTSALAAAMESADSILIAGSKQLAYLTVRANLDVNDASLGRDMTEVQNQLGALIGRLNSILPALPPTVFATPPLAKWRFVAEQTRAGSGRGRTDPRVNAAIGALTQWQAAVSASLLRETVYEPVNTPEGPRNFLGDMTALFNHVDRTVRETTFRMGRRKLEEHRGTQAQLLFSTIQSQDAAARLAGAEGFRQQSYGQRYLSMSVVEGLLNGLAAAADVNKRYETERKRHVASIARLDTVHTWDLSVAEPGMPVPRFTITEAAAVFRKSMAGLGATYVREVDALMDPANGRLDLIPRAARAQRPGFSTGTVGYPSVFFQGRYGGYVDDLVILVHEGGHSVQNMLMTAHGVPYLYAGGPGYFTESFAGLNELIAMDFLYRTAPDRPHRIYYLQRFLDQSTEIFKSARESLLEHVLYDSVAAGTVQTPDDVERLTQAIGSRYSIWFHPGGERTMEWVNASMAVTRPLYRINYVISKLLALNYFAKLEADSSTFVPQYNGLLAGGYGATPDTLLAPLGVQVRADSLIPRAVMLISKRVDELVRLYKEAGM